MTWQPQAEPTQQLARCLVDSLSGRNDAARKQAELMLKQASSSPDFANYLTFFLASPQQPPSLTITSAEYDLVRSNAAIYLKNTIRASYRGLSDASKDYVRSVVLQGLQDQNAQIRNYSGNVITEVVQQGGLLSWPTLLNDLFSLIQNASGAYSQQTQEGGISALLKICEDNKIALDKDYAGERPLTFMYPKLLELTANPVPRVRARSLACLDVFIIEQSPVAVSHLPQTLQSLFALALDESTEVRKQVCRSLLHVAAVSPESIIPNLEGLVNYTITQQKNKEDADLALDAAEFWICLGEDDRLIPHVQPYLPLIIPTLLQSMVYTEDDVLRLESDYDNADEEDRNEDIKPVFAANKDGRNANSNGTGSAAVANGGAADDDLSEGEVSDDDDLFDDDDENGEDSWSLRKCSAAALDNFANYFRDPVFEVTLPYLKENLVHDEWPYREAAVLALGAIAEGCMGAVQPHLPELTTLLLSNLQHEEPVVRQIACWTLGRYSGWAAQLDLAGRQQYFEPMMDGILQRMLDRNKKVQESAASAFANLEERAGVALKPYCGVILRQFVQCFARYKDRNMFILYDCVQTLAGHVESTLQDPELVNLLMPAIFNRWDKVADQAREMFPLQECFSYIAMALERSFEPFAQPVFLRCIKVLHTNLEDAAAATNNPDIDRPEKDFLITSLDLLSAILQAVSREKATAMVAATQPNMFEMLAYCMKYDHADVRQSAYALLGDSAIYVFSQLKPYVPTILDILIPQLDKSHIQYDDEGANFAVVNNASWSLGEISVREKESMQPFVNRLLEKLAVLLVLEKVPSSLHENAAIALGRLGMAYAPQLAPQLNQWAPLFLKYMKDTQWTEEKAHATIGFLQIVALNPQALESCLMDLLIELASISALKMGPDLCWGDEQRLLARNVVSQYRSLIPDFEQFISHMPPDSQQAFRAGYLT